VIWRVIAELSANIVKAYVFPITQAIAMITINDTSCNEENDSKHLNDPP